MSALGELCTLLKSGRDLIVVASEQPEASPTAEVKLYVLEVEAAAGVAGGRAGGFGSRRISCLRGYVISGGECHKICEVSDEGLLGGIEVPYHATAMDFLLPDGSSVVVRGVVDPELVAEYESALRR